MSLLIKKDSLWQFSTSSSGGLGVEFVAIEGGKIWLTDPAGNTVTFYYGAAGAGLAAGLKLPKIGKVQLKIRGKGAGGVAAPASFPNAGKVYVLDTFAGEELTKSDISGVCLFVEAFGGLVGGGSATAMVFGMSPVWLGMAAALAPISSLAIQRMLSTATGVLLMAGVNVGIQAGGGFGAFIGALY